MPEHNKVVARFQDGSVVHGTTLDFFPNRNNFHLDPEGGGEQMQIQCELLKAVFFVKDFTGKPDREDVQGFLAAPAATAHGKKAAVRFKDEEVLCGYTLSYSAARPGFFLTPADAGGNNIRVYVLIAATDKVAVGPAAEALARTTLDDLSATG